MTDPNNPQRDTERNKQGGQGGQGGQGDQGGETERKMPDRQTQDPNEREPRR